MDQRNHDPLEALLDHPRLRQVAEAILQCGTYQIEPDELAGFGPFIFIKLSPFFKHGIAYAHIEGAPSIAKGVLKRFVAVFKRSRTRLRISDAIVTLEERPSEELIRFAKPFGIRVLALGSLLNELDRERASNLVIAAERNGSVLAEHYRRWIVGESDRPRPTPTFDRYALQRVRTMSAYLEQIDRAASNPSHPIRNVDITGMSTGFRNWNTVLYQALLQANTRFDVAYRRARGKHRGIARAFIIDTNRLRRLDLEPLRDTLRMHTDRGFESSIIFTGEKTPEPVISDFSLLAGRTGFESRRLEELDPGDPPPQAHVVDRETSPSEFAEFVDRIDWAMDPNNVAASIDDPADVADAVAMIEELLPAEEVATSVSMPREDGGSTGKSRDSVILRVAYGRTIRYLRDSQKLRQSALTDRLCDTLDQFYPADAPHTLDDSTVSAWENGRNEPSEKYVSTLKAIFVNWTETFVKVLDETLGRAHRSPHLHGEYLRSYLFNGAPRS